MKTKTRKDNYKPGALRAARTARTVLLRMAQDEERAERIRELKDRRPDLTWRRIADAVGVTERAAAEWQRTGGIDYENARALAQVFDVDLDWLWRGPVEDRTPELMDVVAREETLSQVIDRFGRRVDDVEARLGGIDDKLVELAQALQDAKTERVSLVDEIKQILAGQIADMLREQSDLLETIRAIVAGLGVPDDSTLQDHLVQEVRDALARTAPPPER